MTKNGQLVHSKKVQCNSTECTDVFTTRILKNKINDLEFCLWSDLGRPETKA